jgi:16S rRNA (guanine527-N7)-methyltransferase
MENSLAVLRDFCLSIPVPDTDGLMEKTEKFYKILSSANEEFNLTSLTGAEDYRVKHIIDSLTIAKFFPEIMSAKLTLCDIGCGAGFPSLPLAAAFPNLRVFAVDSTGKKINFLQNAAKELNLENLTAIQARAVEMSRREEWRGKFDIITARAVSDAATIYKESFRMRKRGTGKIILYKTPSKVAEELRAVSDASSERGFAWSATPEFDLPGGVGKRQFLFGSSASKF